MTLPVALIDPDPDNVRATVGDITTLAESIERNGLLQAIRVYPADGRYRIQAGHRRLAAVIHLGWTEIPVDVGEPPADDLARLDAMLAENLHREQLNPMEEARAFRRYATVGLNQEQIARRVGRNQSHVSTALMFLTELTDDEQQQLETGQLGRTAAVALMKRRRAEQGRARSDAGRRHRYGYSVPWFNSHHPLADTAQTRCRQADHSPAIRLGPACGQCWEGVIVDDALGTVAAASRPAPVAAPPPPPPPSQSAKPAVARFGDKNRPSRAEEPPPPPAPRLATPTPPGGTRRSCGCTIPAEISDAVVERNPRVHDGDCELAADLERDRLTGRVR